MKKIILATLIIFVGLGLSGCGKNVPNCDDIEGQKIVLSKLKDKAFLSSRLETRIYDELAANDSGIQKIKKELDLMGAKWTWFDEEHVATRPDDPQLLSKAAKLFDAEGDIYERLWDKVPAKVEEEFKKLKLVNILTNDIDKELQKCSCSANIGYDNKLYRLYENSVKYTFQYDSEGKLHVAITNPIDKKLSDL